MGCIIFLLAVLAPRVTLALIWIFTNWLGRAYETVLWPLLGFILMPYTTLAYMAAMLGSGGHITGWWIVLIVLAVLADLSQGESARRARRR